MPDSIDADQVRRITLDKFDLSLGAGLGLLKGRVFRIGHLGDCNPLTLMAELAGCEMGMRAAGVPLRASGLPAAMDVLLGKAPQALQRAA